MGDCTKCWKEYITLQSLWKFPSYWNEKHSTCHLCTEAIEVGYESDIALIGLLQVQRKAETQVPTKEFFKILSLLLIFRRPSHYFEKSNRKERFQWKTPFKYSKKVVARQDYRYKVSIGNFYDKWRGLSRRRFYSWLWKGWWLLGGGGAQLQHQKISFITEKSINRCCYKEDSKPTATARCPLPIFCSYCSYFI